MFLTCATHLSPVFSEIPILVRATGLSLAGLKERVHYADMLCFWKSCHIRSIGAHSKISAVASRRDLQWQAGELTSGWEGNSREGRGSDTGPDLAETRPKTVQG